NIEEQDRRDDLANLGSDIKRLEDTFKLDTPEGLIPIPQENPAAYVAMKLSNAYHFSDEGKDRKLVRKELSDAIDVLNNTLSAKNQKGIAQCIIDLQIPTYRSGFVDKLKYHKLK
ncbi:MAG: hypothetical protein KAQ83_03200, partial [Nanoarchaeota archaeon]|nr:hypothetical protein [Nanoarchaeota archaeon]